MSTTQQPWLRSAGFDLVWFIAPAYLSTALVLLFFAPGETPSALLPLWLWVVCIIGIDVSHVYSTLYRTYFDPEERARYSSLLFVVPLGCWVGGAVLYGIDRRVFWSLLAYLAVFHFVRQQYGFVALYARSELRSRAARLLDTVAVYVATLYPLIYWHSHLPRKFDWFVPGDFFFSLPPVVAKASFWVWVVVLTTFALHALRQWIVQRQLNMPKLLFLGGTALSWYCGIVLFNNDLPFTLTNVASHGIPYIALIWHFQERKFKRQRGEKLVEGRRPTVTMRLFRPAAVPLFLGVLLLLAYLEEALWDGLVWRDHSALFSWAWHLPAVRDEQLLAVIVPLLALPQATHYVLDAFIWRIRKPESEVRAVLEGGR